MKNSTFALNLMKLERMLIMSNYKRGIDVSHWNGDIDWKKVKSSGIDFAIIRAGYGKEISQKDAFFDYNIIGASNAGLDVGVYWFSYAASVDEAIKEANTCHEVIKPYKNKITLPVFYDFEYDTEEYNGNIQYTRYLRTDIIRAFCEEIESLGYKAGYYTNNDYRNNRLNVEELEEYSLWLADYSKLTYTAGDFRQYSSSGKVDGIYGDVDMNVQYVEFETEFSPDVLYKVRINGRHWLPEVKNLEDYAGLYYAGITTDVAIKVTEGTIKYRVHILNGGWLSYVTGYDTRNPQNGYAGVGKLIDAIEIYYYTPYGKPVKKAKYRVADKNGKYYPWQYDNEKTGGQDGYAGIFGKPIARFQMCLK